MTHDGVVVVTSICFLSTSLEFESGSRCFFLSFPEKKNVERAGPATKTSVQRGCAPCTKCTTSIFDVMLPVTKRPL